MKQISAKSTFLYKKVFPLFWFGFLTLMCIAILLSGGRQRPPVQIIFVPVGLAIFGFFLMKKLIWDLADAVYDDGDFLLVRKGPEKERIALSDIMNVSASMMTNPPRITLRLVTPGKFGEEISFSPISGFRLNPFAKNPIAEDLIVRVYRARSKRAV